MHEFIATAKETLKLSREVSLSEVADFGLSRKAVSDLKEGR
jgi:hypothetical protein